MSATVVLLRGIYIERLLPEAYLLMIAEKCADTPAGSCLLKPVLFNVIQFLPTAEKQAPGIALLRLNGILYVMVSAL